jgi:hypothetical protein
VNDRGCVLTVTPDSTGTQLTDDTGTCSISAAGVITGSLRVPASLEPGTLTVSACVGACLDDDDNPGLAGSASLIVEAAPAGKASISVDPNPALPAGLVTITGTGPQSADAGSCAVSIDNTRVDAACSIDSAGQISGSFTLPADAEPGTLTVTVCGPGCVDGIETWRASASLIVGAGPSPTPTVLPSDGVLIPDLTALVLPDAEKSLTAAGLGIAIAGDRNGSVSGQTPAAGERVPSGTVVLVTLSSPSPPANWFLLAAIGLLVIVVMAGTAWTIRHRARRLDDRRWVDKHIRVKLRSDNPLHRAESVGPSDRDFEIKVVVTALEESAEILEVVP